MLVLNERSCAILALGSRGSISNQIHRMDYSQTGGDVFGVYGLPASRKSRLVTFLLAFFLGMFGAHRFYAGKTGTAVMQLILTVTVFGMLISSPWVFVDWIVILCGNFKDDLGRKITRWDN